MSGAKKGKVEFANVLAQCKFDFTLIYFHYAIGAVRCHRYF